MKLKTLVWPTVSGSRCA